MRKPFAKVARRTQVERLRRLAVRDLPAWGLADARVRLLLHGYNTTFRIDAADGRRYALRLNTAMPKPEPNLLAEVSWLAAIAADTGLRVPTPQRTLSGDWAARVPSPDHGRSVAAVLFSWLDGRDLGNRPTLDRARVVGRAMAILHDHASGWSLPAGAELPRFDNVLTDLPNRFDDHPALNAEAREVVLAAYQRAQACQDQAFATDAIIPLHADLHGGNLKWVSTGSTGGGSSGDGLANLRVFDFDDAGLGVPALDLAITVFYLRDDESLEAALKQGYAQVLAAARGSARRARGHGRRAQPAAPRRSAGAGQRRISGHAARLRGERHVAVAALARDREVPA
ncbi:phosphotransferase enzyme family protein [Micropruina sp.]|uniref:phosphotransferase enzyme family protein n=1 Tax=Micropruina sp. TaxID=2737536 RepID=UPI0039E3B6E6